MSTEHPGGTTAGPNRSQPPAPSPPRASRFPDVSRQVLPNGLTLIALQRSSPLVSLKLLFPAGARLNPPADAGLAALTASLLDSGTRSESAFEVATRIERLGGALSCGAGWDGAHLTARLLATHVDAGLDLLCDVAAEPAFAENEIERQRRQRLAELLRLQADPNHLAWTCLHRQLYDDSPYGSSLRGTRETLSRFTREDIAEFYGRHYSPHGGFAVAVGDFDIERVATALSGALEPSGLEPAPVPAIEPEIPESVSVHIVDRPGAAQTQLLLGHVGISRRHPDFLPMLLVTTLLGGKFTSRINLNLRERNGFTYGATCMQQGRIGPGPLTVSAAVANQVAGAAVREVLFELERIRDEPVTGEELDDTRSFMIGVLPYTLQQLSDLSARLETLALYGLPDDYYERYPKALAAVTIEEVQELARRHIRPDRLAIVAVGPADELREQLEPLGAVTVHQPED